LGAQALCLKGFLLSILTTTLLMVPAACGRSESTTTGSQMLDIGLSISKAAPLNVTVNGIVECGTGYTSHELYDVKVTVMEIMRGQNAWGILQQADSKNVEAGQGMDYLLARIKFEYYARGAPGDCCHELTGAQFVAYSANGLEYPSVALTPPAPELKGRACAGSNFEGWVVFKVSENDSKPVAMFNAGIGGVEAIEHGGDIWFQLY
jgi:hypothetical protein